MEIASTIEDHIPEDSLVAIFQHIDTGSLFKTVRMVSRVWRKLADKVHPTGDEKFADNEVTIYYRKGVFRNNSITRWVFHHNTKINRHIVKKLLGKRLRTLIKEYFIDYIVPKGKNTLDTFLSTLIWVNGVIRLTDKSFDVILNSTSGAWNFKNIYKHAGVPEQDQRSFDASPNTTCTGVPWPTTLALIKKFNRLSVNLYKIYPDRWQELIDLKQVHKLGKMLSMDMIYKLRLNEPFLFDDISSDIYDNPNLTIADAIHLDLIPSYMKYLTLQMIEDHPEIDWNEHALDHIKVTDENFDVILNHRLLSAQIFSNTEISLRHMWPIAEKLADDVDDADSLLNDLFIEVSLRYSGLTILLKDTDWNGLVKTLPWKKTLPLLKDFELTYSYQEYD